MELSKDELIFPIIDKQYDLLDDTSEWIISILNGQLSWSENEFNNFINVMTSLKFEQKIQE